MLRVATDIGGTFTDLVFVTPEGEVVTGKSHTTPAQFEKGVMDVIEANDIEPGEFASFVHGTTIVINAITEKKGARVGLLTSEGFRDIIEIGRGNRPDFFNLEYRKPEPFVPRHLRREVGGRINYKGVETAPLELSEIPAILDDFRDEGVEAVAISFINSYANPAHEEAAMTMVKELWPEVSAVASHQITREWREYERTNTAVLSAYVQPITHRYLDRLTGALYDAGMQCTPYIMQSNCGVDTVQSARQIPITMVESGPASGIWGAAALGRLIGEPDVIAIDIGGTTAKCGLITGGEVKLNTDYLIERSETSAGYPAMVPVVDLVEIGQGGGSIAWVDEFQRLHVGPQSAGAVPGPVSYGIGGTEATTTDANLALGCINPHYFCGGTIEADMDAVDRALSDLAATLDAEQQEVARGIVRIANNNMAALAGRILDQVQLPFLVGRGKIQPGERRYFVETGNGGVGVRLVQVIESGHDDQVAVVRRAFVVAKPVAGLAHDHAHARLHAPGCKHDFADHTVELLDDRRDLLIGRFRMIAADVVENRNSPHVVQQAGKQGLLRIQALALTGQQEAQHRDMHAAVPQFVHTPLQHRGAGAEDLLHCDGQRQPARGDQPQPDGRVAHALHRVADPVGGAAGRADQPGGDRDVQRHDAGQALDVHVRVLHCRLDLDRHFRKRGKFELFLLAGRVDLREQGALGVVELRLLDLVAGLALLPVENPVETLIESQHDCRAGGHRVFLEAPLGEQRLARPGRAGRHADGPAAGHQVHAALDHVDEPAVFRRRVQPLTVAQVSKPASLGQSGPFFAVQVPDRRQPVQHLGLRNAVIHRRARLVFRRCPLRTAAAVRTLWSGLEGPGSAIGIPRTDRDSVPGPSRPAGPWPPPL
ncbi:MAG: hydantoinase/oxoprolinase family protein [Thioalkalivibrio sp.]